MACRPTCIQPSPTNAHCSACHHTFGGITGFDRHRRAGECLKARDIGMHADHNGIWRQDRTGDGPSARRGIATADENGPAVGRDTPAEVTA